MSDRKPDDPPAGADGVGEEADTGGGTGAVLAEEAPDGEPPDWLHPEWLGPGIGVGAGGGTAMALLSGNYLLWVPLGFALGIALGLGFGAAMDGRR